ncbi:HMG box-containing protein 4 [Lepeophtheirus salmonis]|uniref:HMG box domain containing 4 [Geospiza fortis] n=2 Tax=Lepeophtheirus salmonis TaxID=72036 RepID=A0A0K2V371_LEPSM
MEDPGVSRSGRIRKKSSKLVDYESVDEIPPPQIIRHTEKIKRGSDEFRDSEEIIRDEDFEAIPHLGAEWDNEDYDPDEEDMLMLDDSITISRHSSSSRKDGTRSIKRQTSTNSFSKRRNLCDISAYTSWAKDARENILKSSPRIYSYKLNQRLQESWTSLGRKERLVWENRAIRFNNFLKNKTGKTTIKQLKAMELSPVSSVPNQNSGLFKVVGTEPMDSAAHLKLLGESLSIIGERLTEHEGQIAVSGSLSVLLDSLICAMGPLMCLTQQVPELNTVPQNKLSSILDNVAYIMPGL